MAVTIDVIIDSYFTWGSYPYDTWGGDGVVTWDTTVSARTTMTSTDTLHIGTGEGDLSFDDVAITFAESTSAFDSHVALSFNVGKNCKDNLLLTDTFSRRATFRKYIEERIKAAETYWDNILFHINVLENVLLEDYANRHSQMVHLQPLSVKDKHTSKADILRLEDVKTTDEHNHIAEFVRAVTENVRVVEKPIKECETYHEEEPFGIGDYANREYGINSYYTITLRDVVKRTSRYQRMLNDLIGVAEKVANNVDTTKFEELLTEDLYLKACEGILSNIYITEGESDSYDFERAIKTPPSYTEFMDFKVGEYEYQEALVRVTLDAVSQVQPTAQGIVMHVDIPDTDDRGTIAIANTSEPTRVDFHKPYYVVPEVQVSLRSASTSQGVVTPNIVNITKTYFTVELLTAGGTRTTGVLSWASKGY